jgi:Raf kinase inhibitor-like YbhB/YbcL family protein
MRANNVDSLIGHVALSETKRPNAMSGEKGRQIPLFSSAFENGETIPSQFSGSSDNISPPLNWGDAPKGTRQWLLVCEDPDAPGSKPFVHWVIALPEHIEGLEQGITEEILPRGAHQTTNDAGRQGYFGPRPPQGHGVHHYYFQLFAIDTHIDLGERFDRKSIVRALKGHILGYGELVGTFETK